MSGIIEIAHAISLTSLVLGGAVSTVTKVSAQSFTTGGFEFGKLYELPSRFAKALGRPGKSGDCRIRAKVAKLNKEINFRCSMFLPYKDEDGIIYAYAQDFKGPFKVTMHIMDDSKRGFLSNHSLRRGFVLTVPEGQFARKAQVWCLGGRKDGFQYNSCKAVSDDITVEAFFRLQE